MISMEKCGAFIERFAYESQGYRILQQKVNHFHLLFFSLVFILFDEQKVFQITIEQIFSNKSQKNNREMVEMQNRMDNNAPGMMQILGMAFNILRKTHQ